MCTLQLADKNDLVLMHKVVSAGVEFAVVKASFQGVLSNIVLSALAVWLPLLPLIFLVRRIMEDKSGSSRSERAPGKCLSRHICDSFYSIYQPFPGPAQKKTPDERRNRDRHLPGCGGCGQRQDGAGGGCERHEGREAELLPAQGQDAQWRPAVWTSR